MRRFLFETIHDVALMMIDRERVGREASVVDSQAVKASAAQARGYGAGKNSHGRKRHIIVNTAARLLMVNLTTADIADDAGFKLPRRCVVERTFGSMTRWRSFQSHDPCCLREAPLQMHFPLKSILRL
jgi:hypothetical protein